MKKKAVTEFESALLDIHQVALYLAISERHVHRLSNDAKMPPPIKLGNSIRWSRQELMTWVNGGCQPLEGAK